MKIRPFGCIGSASETGSHEASFVDTGGTVESLECSVNCRCVMLSGSYTPWRRFSVSFFCGGSVDATDWPDDVGCKMKVVMATIGLVTEHDETTVGEHDAEDRLDVGGAEVDVDGAQVDVGGAQLFQLFRHRWLRERGRRYDA
jgi:hypothetical protein